MFRSSRAAGASSTRSCAGHGRGVPREESSMSIKSKVLAGVATLALVGGVGTAGVLGAGTASAAPRPAASRVSTCSATSSARTPRRTSRLTCCGRARRSASRSSCSGPRTTTRRWTGRSRSPARWRTCSAGLVSANTALHYGCIAGVNFTTCPFNIAGFNVPRAIQTSWRSRTSTRRSAWTRACAWAWPRPRSRVRASRCSRVACRPRRCGSWTPLTSRSPLPGRTGTSR